MEENHLPHLCKQNKSMDFYSIPEINFVSPKYYFEHAGLRKHFMLSFQLYQTNNKWHFRVLLCYSFLTGAVPQDS
jgi:hypothetical protein